MIYVTTSLGYVESSVASMLWWTSWGNGTDRPAKEIVGELRDTIIEFVQEHHGVRNPCCKLFDNPTANFCQHCGKKVVTDEDYYYRLSDQVWDFLQALHLEDTDSFYSQYGDVFGWFIERCWRYTGVQELDGTRLIDVPNFDGYVRSLSMFGAEATNWCDDMSEYKISISR